MHLFSFVRTASLYSDPSCSEGLRLMASSLAAVHVLLCVLCVQRSGPPAASDTAWAAGERERAGRALQDATPRHSSQTRSYGCATSGSTLIPQSLGTNNEPRYSTEKRCRVLFSLRVTINVCTQSNCLWVLPMQGIILLFELNNNKGCSSLQKFHSNLWWLDVLNFGR